jgi:hypothetical protein
LAKTKYFVKAKLDLSGEEDFKFKINLNIREPEEKAAEDVEKKDTDSIKTWCCCDQGKSSLKCSFNKTVFTSQETAEVHCKIDNEDCKVDCKTVKLEILMKAELHSGHKM